MSRSLSKLAESMRADQFVHLKRWIGDRISASRTSQKLLEIDCTDCHDDLVRLIARKMH